MKMNYEKLHQELLDAGMHPTRAKEMTKQIRQDMIDWPEVYEDWDRCSWALERGFLPGRLKIYGKEFNEDTYHLYCPDYDFFMAHPMNNHFIFWINDKLTLKYMMNSAEMKQYMPEYYLYIENDGHYSYLMDSPEDIPKDENYLYHLLVEKKHLALKPNRGAGGKGFFGLSYRDGEIYYNDRRISCAELEALKPELNGYIVTAFIEQSNEMEGVFPGTDCALRLVLYKKLKKKPEDPDEYGPWITYARFGSSRSNAASNLCHGGLAIRVDWETGRFEGGFRGNTEFWGEEGMKGFRTHPDTGADLEGKTIPHWDKVKSGLIDICRYMSSLDFFGMDVIITKDGFQLCEINSAPSAGLGQFHQGKCCLDNDEAVRFFESKKRPSKKSFMECFMAALEMR